MISRIAIKKTAFNLNAAIKYIIRFYSVLKLLTGLLNAAFTAWKLTVANVMINAIIELNANTSQLMLIR